MKLSSTRKQPPPNLAHALGLHHHAGDAYHVEAPEGVEVYRLDVLVEEDDLVPSGTSAATEMRAPFAIEYLSLRPRS
jgi:hypothetical protein